MKFALVVFLAIALQGVCSISLENLEPSCGCPQQPCGCAQDNVQVIHENAGQPIIVNTGHHGSCGCGGASDWSNSHLLNHADLGERTQHCPGTVIKGRPEIVVHRQPTLIVKRKPTTVRINHAPMVVKSSPIVFHRSGDRIHRPIIRKRLQRPVQIRPYVVNVVKPIHKKVLIEKQPCGCASNNWQSNLPAEADWANAASWSGASNAGSWGPSASDFIHGPDCSGSSWNSNAAAHAEADAAADLAAAQSSSCGCPSAPACGCAEHL